MKKVFIISLLLSAFIAPNSVFAAGLIEGGSNPASELLLASASAGASDCPEGGGTVDANASQSEPSFTISGPDAVTRNNTAQYTANIEGEVVWSVTGNVGTGGGISQSGELTIGSNTCGAATVTAWVNGTAATRDVRVTDSGQWVLGETCNYGGHYKYEGYCCNRYTPKAGGSDTVIVGKFLYNRDGYAQIIHDIGSCNGVSCDGCDTDCPAQYAYAIQHCPDWPHVYQGCSGCGGSVYCGCSFIHASKRYEWQCPTTCTDINNDGDDYYAIGSCSTPATDCNDNDNSIHPGAAEVCGDGIDNDCDGAIDDDCEVGCEDNDGDGYYGFDATTCPEGDDCDDDDPAVTTGPTWYLDNDGDGYGSLLGSTEACEQPDGYVSNPNDCNDANPLVSVVSIWFQDFDLDGYGNPAITLAACGNPGGYTENADDCDDAEPTAYPGHEEICGDGIDNDCDGEIDEGCCGVESVKLTPSAVWPAGTAGNSQADVIVRLKNSAPADGCTIHLKVDPVEHSGGHQHSNNNPIRPRGSINGINHSIDQFAIVTVWDGNTETTATYESSEIAGKETIKYRQGWGDPWIEENRIKVRVPNLEPFYASEYCRLTGETDTHPSNHHVTTWTKINTWLICQDYYEATGTTLGINDMSLVWGGLFDINGNWNTPHITHREGLDVDIDRRVWDPETNSYILIKCKDDDNLEKAINDNDGSLHCESGGRKHVDF